MSIRDVLTLNGIQVGRHGFAVCPFHGDHDASLKVYDNGRGWVCYGCHKGGDVINLAMELYGLGFQDAVRKLNEEYNKGFSVAKLFLLYNSGIQTKRDKLTVSFSEDDASSTIVDFKTLSSEELRDKYKLPPDGRDWTVDGARADVMTHNVIIALLILGILHIQV